MFATFKARAEAVSAHVHRVPGRAEAIDLVLTLLREEGLAEATSAAASAVWAEGPLLRGIDRSRIRDRIPGLTFDVTREAAAAAKVGVSEMDWAIAATGTVAQKATQAALRLVSTLPAIHVALVSTERIVPDLATLFARLRPEEAGYISLITGPSRTADIERVLTIGVHGPKRLEVICIDGWPRGDA